MTNISPSYDGVALTTPLSFGYQRRSERGTQWYFGRLLAELLRAGGLDKSAIDGLAIASYTLAPDNAAALCEQLGLSVRWLDQYPLGGASAIVALRRAARAVQCGDADIVACLGADVMTRENFAHLVNDFSRYTRDYVQPYGAAGPNGVFGAITRYYLERFGLNRADFAPICLAQRYNASLNPLALLREPLTLADYLNAPPIAAPLHLYDCVMPCCGGEGFLVMSEARARREGLAFARIAATFERHNAYADSAAAVPIDAGWRRAADALYAAAAATPNDIDFVQLYDDYPVVVAMQLCNLGFCGEAELADFLRSTDFTVTGQGLPLNTGGGQLSVGQAGAAGGFLGLVEGLRQLTGQTLGAPVNNPRLGLISGYGMVNYRHGLSCGAAILSVGAREHRP
jgi:acetyl-CoA acetyltransferase